MLIKLKPNYDRGRLVAPKGKQTISSDIESTYFDSDTDLETIIATLTNMSSNPGVCIKIKHYTPKDKDLYSKF